MLHAWFSLSSRVTTEHLRSIFLETTMTYPLVASLATEVFKPPFSAAMGGSAAWEIQPKIDGHRIIIDYRGEIPRVLNRNGRVYSAGPFRLTVPDWLKGKVIDGEYVPDLRKFAAFDLLYHHEFDDDLNYTRTLSDRRSMLLDVVMTERDNQWLIVPSHRATAEWVDFYRAKAITGGIPMADAVMPIDGVLFKKKGIDYVPGKNAYWLKYKFLSEVDAFVTDLNIDDKSNCEVSLYDPLSESTFPVGKASTNGKLGVKMNTVVTVRFLKFTKGGRLREPRIVQVRDDKTPHECGIDQLIPFVPHLNQE